MIAFVVLAIPAFLALSYGVAWGTSWWITRNCDCDFCQQTPDELL